MGFEMQVSPPSAARSMTAVSVDATQIGPHREIETLATPAWKSCVDVIGAACLLVGLAPLLLLVAAYIKCVSPGPVFFIQSRIGHGGKRFRILKFRTMQTDDEYAVQVAHRDHVATMARSAGAISKPDYENRIIPGGRWLRRTSLDELPQLFNVLIGTMSLVGPRPDVLELEDYEEWQLQRFGAVPGITGLWQVSGKNSLSFQRMVELDLAYIDRRSLRLDLWILAKTVAVVLARDNE